MLELGALEDPPAKGTLVPADADTRDVSPGLCGRMPWFSGEVL